MKKIKKIVIPVLLVLCLFLVLITLVSCNKSEPISLYIITDVALADNTFKLTFQGNQDNKDAPAEISVNMPLNGRYMYENFPSGTFDKVIVSRYGVETVYENVKIEGEDGEADYDVSLFSISHYTTKKLIYKIENSTQFKNLAHMSGVMETISYKIDSSIDFKNESLYIPSFNGIIDGAGIIQNSRLSNINVEFPGDNVGIFGVNTGTIKNLDFENITVKGADNVGAIVGYNSGNVEYCSVFRSNVSGRKFVGGAVGVDNAFLRGLSVSNTVVDSSTGYFGPTVGISYTNIGLGAFGYRPSGIDATTPINSTMSAFDILKIGISNWTALEERAKLLKGDFWINFVDLIDIARKTLTGTEYETPLMIIILNIFEKVVNVVNHTEAKLMYDDTQVSEKQLGEAIGIISSYLVNDPENSSLAYYLNQPLIQAAIALAFTTMEIDLKPQEFLDLVLDNPLSGAAFYNEKDNEYLEVTAANIDDTFVDSSTRQAIAEFKQAIYTFHVSEEIQRQAAIERVNLAYVDLMIAYVNEAKHYVFLGDFIEWQDAEPDIFTSSSKEFVDGVYKLSFTTDPDKFMKKFIDYANDAISRIELAALSIGDLDASYVSPRTYVSLKYNKTPTVTAEVFDNGFIRFWSLNDFDVEIIIHISDALRAEIRQVADENGLSLDLYEVKFSFKFMAPFTNLYSYSKTDTDLELQKTIFKGNKITLEEALDDYRGRNTQRDDP